MILDMPHNKLSLTLFSRCFVRFLAVIKVIKFFRIRRKIPRNVFNKKGEIRKIGQCLILPSSMGHLHFICWKFVLLFQPKARNTLKMRLQNPKSNYADTTFRYWTWSWITRLQPRRHFFNMYSWCFYEENLK